MKQSSLLCTVIAVCLAPLATAQTKPHSLPCDFSGELLHEDKGKPVWFTSDQMKSRATQREEIGPMLKQADIKGAAIVDVLVNASGGVACVKSLAGHPMIRAGVEKALKKWTFKTATDGGHAVAYLGEMEFSLCNISCGDAGPSMTLLK
jgi:hypothetical protein